MATLKARIKRLGRSGKYSRTVNALNDVSIDVHYGTVLGIIGSNGAGKSSLMRAFRVGFLSTEVVYVSPTD